MLIGFAERVFFKQPPKGPQHGVEGNMAARMFLGIDLGYHHTSNTFRVANAEGYVIKVRAIMRRPVADRWRADLITAMKESRQNPTGELLLGSRA